MPWDVYWEYRIYATEREPATQMSGERHARPQKGGFLWMRTRKIARRPQNGLILWTNLRHCRGNGDHQGNPV